MLSRRRFLGTLAGAVPLAVIVRQAHAASMSFLAAAPEALDAIGEAVLPSELGANGTRRVVGDFRRWMEGYRENAEVDHAYGNSRLRFTGPTPATRWTKQLDDLDAAARSAKGKSFASLTVAERQELLRPLLAAERGPLGGAPDGSTHVAAALLAFFYGSSEAADLCYEASIGRRTCRPLNEQSKQPVALKARR